MFSGLLKMLPTFRKDNVKDTESPLNYDDLISLDAETLAEEGIAGAYQRLLPELKKHIRNPAQIYEYIDSEIPEYKVSCNGEEFTIYSAEVPVLKRKVGQEQHILSSLLLTLNFVTQRLRFLLLMLTTIFQGCF
jgi:hypothetical protein